MHSHFHKEIIDLISRTIEPDLVLLFIRDNEYLNLKAKIGNEELPEFNPPPRHRVDECLCGICASKGEAVYSPDIFLDSCCTWQECKKAGMSSFAALPLIYDNKVIGVLGLGAKQQRDFSLQKGILEPLAAAVAISLKNNQLLTEQKKAEETLRLTESRFRQLFETMTEGVALHSLVLGPDGNAVNYVVEDINKAFVSTLGLRRDTVLGRLATQAYSTDTPPYLDIYTEVVRTGRPHQFETHFKPLDKYLSVSAIPWGKNGFASIFLDITKRRKTEEANTKALDFVKTLLDSSPMGIRVFEGDSGSCVLSNQAAADISGGSIDDMLKYNFRELKSWQDIGLDQIAEQVLSDGAARPVETEMVSTFGKPVTARYFLSRFYVEGKPHLLVMGRDATEEKKLEEQKKQIESQMLHVQKLESLGVLAGGIAHDFNNILMAIIGNADLALLTAGAAPAAVNYIHEIKHAARRAADLAHQMLAYSGKGHFVIETLDINRIICEMTALLDVSVSKKATLNLELDINSPFVKADATQLSQIIMNLVINASEAMEEKNGEITIATGVMECDQAFLNSAWSADQLPAGKYVYMRVSDTGCGMDKETRDRLFEPFFTTKFTGRGLGMSAVLGIVRGHKGLITVQSEKGKGSDFTVYLPAAESAIPDSSTTPAQQSSGIKSGGTVLLVDDEEIIRHMVSMMLEFFGFKILTAADGLEAIETFRQHSDDIVCVLLDLTMPRMDGEQTCMELRRLKPDLPIIMSSGFGEQEILEKLKGSEGIAFIQKPYQMNSLEEKIRQVLEHRQ